jgi:hypothetical protein
LERRASGEVHEDEEPAAIVGRLGVRFWLDLGVSGKDCGIVVSLEVEVRICRGVCECECDLDVGLKLKFEFVLEW